MTLLVFIALIYFFVKFGGAGLGIFGVKLAQFTMMIAFKYFKIILIVVGIFLLASFLDDLF